MSAILQSRSFFGVAVRNELTFAISVKSLETVTGTTYLEISETSKCYPPLDISNLDSVSLVHHITSSDAACISRDCGHESHPDVFAVSKQPVTFLVNDYAASCAIHRHQGPSSSFFCLWCLMGLLGANDPGKRTLLLSQKSALDR